MRRIQFFYPALPSRMLSPNATERHLYNSDAIHELRSGVQGHLLYNRAVRVLTGGSVPLFERARVSVTWCMTKRKPSIMQCPRCMLWALEHRRSNKKRCLCYRPLDPTNAVSALKPFFDGITDAGIWKDDTWDYVEIGRIARRQVIELLEEGLDVEIEELT